MKVFIAIIIVFSLGLFLTGCSEESAKVEYNEKVDFNRMVTYNWFDNPRYDQDDQVESNTIRFFVEKHLAAKGFKKVSENPDFLLTETSSKKITYDRYWRTDTTEPTGGQMKPLRFARYPFQKADLIIKVIEPDLNSVVWKGISSSTVEDVITPYSRQKRLNQQVARILENFPPRHGKTLSKASKPYLN